MFRFGRISPFVILLGFIATAIVEPQCHRVPELGEPIAGLTPAQRDEFERGRLVFEREFDIA